MNLVPAALDREQAAAYVGLKLSTFELAVRERRAPQPRQIAARRVVWLRQELDSWLLGCPVSEQLPPENTGKGGRNSAVSRRKASQQRATPSGQQYA